MPTPNRPRPERSRKETTSIKRLLKESLSLEGLREILTSDITEVRARIRDLTKASTADESTQALPREQEERLPPIVRPTEKNAGMIAIRAANEELASMTPYQLAELLAIPADMMTEARSLSEAYDEVLRRMSQLIFVPHTHPIFALAHEIFQEIRIRADDIAAEKPFDQIFREQLSWYYEERILEQSLDLSPALAYHWRSYAGDVSAGRYEDNLLNHHHREIKLYGLLMKSFFRILEVFFRRHFPEVWEDSQGDYHLSLDQAVKADSEPDELRSYAMSHLLQTEGSLLKEVALMDYFEEDLSPQMQWHLDALVPRGMDALYFFDTNLFVTALVQRARLQRGEQGLGAVLNTAALDKLLEQNFTVESFLRLPTDEMGRIDEAALARKNLLLWKEIRRPEGEESEHFLQYDQVPMDLTDLEYLAQQVAKAFATHSNIYEAFAEIAPDCHQSLVTRSSFFSRRFEKIAVLARELMPDGDPRKTLVMGVFGTLSKGDWRIWQKKVPKLKGTPYRHLQRLAARIRVDEEQDLAYESQWRFLHQQLEKAWDPDYPRYLQRVGRLSGWRKQQRNVRTKLLVQTFESMHWHLEDQAEPIKGKGPWWQVMEQMRAAPQTARQLTLPFLMRDGRILVCRFPYLQR